MARREMRTSDLASLAGRVREEALAAAGPERREQMARAER